MRAFLYFTRPTPVKTAALLLTMACAILVGCFAPRPPASSADAKALDQPEPPVGILGHRLGTYLTIEGYPATPTIGKGFSSTLVVDQVGDRKLDRPVSIWVSNFLLPAGEKCVFKGFETGGWVGIPLYAQIATNAESAHPVPYDQITVEQSPWHFHRTFRVLLVVQPQTLKEKL